MNCGSFKRLFSAYLDGELNSRTAAELESHLENCTGCAGMLDAYRTGIGSLKRSVDIEPPQDMFERVMAAVNAGEPAAEVIPLRSGGRRTALAAAAVVLIALVGSLFYTGGNQVDMALVPQVDSTLDVVNAEDIQMPVEDSGRAGTSRPAQRAYLASYETDEPSFSYGVSNHPVIVESGVNTVAE